MTIPATTSGQNYRAASDYARASLYELLIALGFAQHDRVPICTQSPGRRDQFRSEVRMVADLAGWSPPQDRCVWFGANPVGRHVPDGRKGGEADVTRMRTLFADFDVKPGRSLDTLAHCYAASHALVEYVGAEPVAMVESGHGLQPLWRIGSLRGDSNVVDRDWTRQEVRETWWRFGAVALKAAQDAMWSVDGAQNLRTIDGVFNIDRILRCPGSINWKDPDNPVPVRTALLGGGRVSLRDLVARLDRDGVTALRRTRDPVAGVPTDFGEARQWIEALPGATADLAELLQLPSSRVLGAYLDPAAMVNVIANGCEGAHKTMIVKVQHAVYAAQEGRAGLVVALHSLGEAYLSVMEARARGELPSEGRDAATATREWQSAVRGAVAKARGRKLPNVRAWAERVCGNGHEPEADGRRAIRCGVYAPVYRRYRR